MSQTQSIHGNKVPQVAAAFWVTKIAATTLGETGGDTLSMSLGLGYAASTGIFLALLLVLAGAQIAATSYHRFLYWAVIVATTTVGTTMADFADRSMGVGYVGGSLALFALLAATLLAWKLTLGTVSFDRIADRKVECFYWLTIVFSNTLGTALGDFLADTSSLGFEGGAMVFAGMLVVVLLCYFYTGLSRSLLFWAAFILTRPLGATLGDLLTKPHDKGGLDLSRAGSSLVLGCLMLGCIVLSERKAGIAS
jgi:uncharacterized membrane-anchored protein